MNLPSQEFEDLLEKAKKKLGYPLSDKSVKIACEIFELDESESAKKATKDTIADAKKLVAIMDGILSGDVGHDMNF